MVTVPNMTLEEWRKENIRLMVLAGASQEDINRNMEKLEPMYYQGYYPHELIRTDTPQGK